MKKKKCFKCFAMLLAMLMFSAMMPTVAWAGIVDVDEGADDGVTITRNYDTTIVIFMEEVDAEGNILNKNLGSFSVDNHLDLDSAEGQGALLASKETALANFSAEHPEYEVYDCTESARISYNSPQVDEGGNFSSIDDLVHAYIAGGSVSQFLDINKFESYRVIYYVLNKDATETTPEPQAVSTIKVEDATLDFKPGETPKFTAESSEPDLYYVYLEMWNEVGSSKYITSHDFFNRDEELLIKQFEEGKEYTYSVWVKPKDVYADNGDFSYYATTLSGCNKLVLNGKDITITAEMTSDMEDAGIWLNKVASFTAEKNTPKIIEGMNGKWTQGSKDGLTFRSDAEFTDFISVAVDGDVIDAKNYDVKEGSTIVTLKADYLGTLSTGEHTLSINSTNGSAETTFTIESSQTSDSSTEPPATEDINNPQTADNSHMKLWIISLVLAIGGLAGTFIYRQKRKYNI